jgi:hypothetical protein
MTSAIDGRAHVALHIGTMKSGTSYLQAILRRNMSQLGEVGVLAPGEMVPAVVDVLDRRNVTKKTKVSGAWERFLEQVESWDGHLVVASQEFLSGASAEEARAVVATFGEQPVKVVVTCRDLLRVIPSHWQTTIKNGGTVSFAEYVQLLLADDEGEEPHRYATGFWRHHDLPAIVEAWAGAVGLENVVLVTVPPSGAPRDQLWSRFAEAVGMPPFDCDLSTNAKSNLSLTYAETEMLRQVNTGLRKSLNQVEYRLLVNKYLANKLLRQPPESVRPSDRPSFGRESHEKIRHRADDVADALEKLEVPVIGGVHELRIEPYAGDPDRQDSTGPRDPLPESVAEAIMRLVTRLARAEREVSRLRRGGGSWNRRRRIAEDELDTAEDEDSDA